MHTEDFQRMEQSFDFWPQLHPRERQLLLDNTTSIQYEKGSHLFSASQDCLGILIITEGELRSYILSEDGRDVTLYRLLPGDVCILSATCLLRDITFDVQIDAEKDTRCLLLSASVFAELQNANVYVENFALRQAASRFSQVMGAMEQMLFMRFDRRLALFLLDESQKNQNLQIDLTHEQIAKYIGSAREVVSRTLKQFEKQGLVTLHRGGLTLQDPQRLQQYT